VAEFSIPELTDATFAERIKEGVTVVDFWAPWCAPCLIQGPILEQVASQVGNRATVAKINVDREHRTALQLGIQSIPVLLIFRDGRPVDGFLGVQSKTTLLKAINEAIKA
jgi:thioredoxin 1